MARERETPLDEPTIGVVLRRAWSCACLLALIAATRADAQTAAHGFTQMSGATSVADGAALVGTVALQDGTLSGTGTIRGALSNAARVVPGGSPGVLTVEGDFEQSADGTLEIEMAGPGAGAGHDLLRIAGTATLGGVLEIVRDPAFTPPLGETFTVAEWQSREGEFAGVIGGAVAEGRGFEPRYEDDGLLLVVVADDAPAVAVAAGPGAPAAGTTATPGESGVPMLQAAVDAADTGDDAVLRELTLQASGTGDDAMDVARVAVYEDADGDGAVGAEERLLAEGGFGGDDGDVTLTLDDPLLLPAGDTATLLVVYDLAGELAAGSVPSPWGLPLALLGLIGVRAMSRRRLGSLPLAVPVLAVLTLAACGGDDGGPTGPEDRTRTYEVELVELEATGQTTDQVASVAGLPIAGTRLTVGS